MKNYFSMFENFQESDIIATTLESLTNLNKIISSSQDELDFFYETGGLDLILKLLHADNKLAHVCLKILVNACKRNVKFRKELIKNNIFYFLSIQLQKESDWTRKNLVLYSTLMIVLVHGNDDAQDQIRMSGCLSYLACILNTFLVNVKTEPLPYKNIELLVYSIIASSKDPQHVKNQTEVGWITPKIVQFLGNQTNVSDVDQIEVAKCFWSLLKSILHKNEFNQQIFLKCSGFVVLFRCMQKIVDEEKREEFGGLLIKMTGVLIRLKSQKEFLHHASSYCSIMILLSLLNTYNALVVQHVIIFLDSLTQEIPHALQLVKDKQIFRCLVQAKITLLKSKMSVELCEGVWNRTVLSLEALHDRNMFITDGRPIYKTDTSTELSYSKNQFCNIHESDALKRFHLYSDYLFNFYKLYVPFENSKIQKMSDVNTWRAHLKNQLKERKTLKVGKMNCNRERKSVRFTRISVKRIIQFFGKFCPFFRIRF